MEPESVTLEQMLNQTANNSEKSESVVVLDENQSLHEKLKYSDGSNSLHQKVLARLLSRKRIAKQWAASRVDDWDEIDDFLRGRIDLTHPAVLGDGSYDYSKREMPYDRSIVVPVAFSILTVRHTQELNTLLSRTPVIQVVGVGPEDVIGAKLMETVLDYDARQTNLPLVLHQILWDVERYGVGIWYVTFEREFSKKIKPKNVKKEDFGPLGDLIVNKLPGIFEPDEQKITKEYNRILPVNPRRFLPDPRVSLANLQRGEFIGHTWTCGFSQIRELSVENGGPYFNVEAAKKHGKSSAGKAGGNVKKSDFSGQNVDELDPGSYELTHMQVKIVPSEWGLGPSGEQEIWWFTFVNDAVIIRAHPCPYDHGDFTYVVAEGVPDFHSLDNPGWGELLLGIQRLSNWLYNTHVEAIRKSLNGALLYSPDLVNEIDLLNPHPAGHVRMTKFARDLIISGRIQDPRQLYSQLFQQDFTGSHIRDVMTLMDFAQRLSGANDPQQGMPLPSRRTLGELQTIMATSSQRIATTTRLVDAMAISPCVRQMIANRQQLTEVERWYRIVGDTAKFLMPRSGENLGDKFYADSSGGLLVLVGRDDIFGDFDYVGHTGSIVSDLSRDPETWARVLQFVGSVFPMMMNPQLYPDGKVIDVREVFLEMARTMGIKDIDRFLMSIQQQAPTMSPMQQSGQMLPQESQLVGGGVNVVPDEEYLRGVESGDYVTPEEFYQQSGGA